MCCMPPKMLGWVTFDPCHRFAITEIWDTQSEYGGGYYSLNVLQAGFNTKESVMAEGGALICFLECMNTWVLTHAVLVYVKKPQLPNPLEAEFCPLEIPPSDIIQTLSCSCQASWNMSHVTTVASFCWSSKAISAKVGRGSPGRRLGAGLAPIRWGKWGLRQLKLRVGGGAGGQGKFPLLFKDWTH